MTSASAISLLSQVLSPGFSCYYFVSLPLVLQEPHLSNLLTVKGKLVLAPKANCKIEIIDLKGILMVILPSSSQPFMYITITIAWRIKGRSNNARVKPQT